VVKGQAMGMVWWVNNPMFSSRAPGDLGANAAAGLAERLDRLEAAVAGAPMTSRQAVPAGAVTSATPTPTETNK